MKYSIILLLASATTAQAETIYSVYNGPTLELQFESTSPLTAIAQPTDGSIIQVGSLVKFDTVGAITSTFGIITPISGLGMITISANEIYMHAVNSLTLDFNGDLPTSPGIYSLVPMNVVDFPNGVSGSYYQLGLLTDLQRFPSATVPLDKVVVTEHPEPGAWLLMAMGMIVLIGYHKYHMRFNCENLYRSS